MHALRGDEIDARAQIKADAGAVTPQVKDSRAAAERNSAMKDDARRRTVGREPATLQKCFQHASPWKDKFRSLQTVQGTETIRAYSSCYIHIPHIPTKDQRTGAG